MRSTVTELMTQPPLVVLEDASVRDAVGLLLNNRAPQLDVVDETGQLLGSVPDYELLKAQMAGEGEKAVKRVMSGSAVRIDAESTSDFAAAVFRDGRYQRLPVVEDGHVVGQIGRCDVMRLLNSVSQPESSDENLDSTIQANSMNQSVSHPRFAANC